MYFIALQGTYSSLELGLFLHNKLLSLVCHDELRASSHLVPLLDSFLQQNTLSLSDIAFIAVDKGPGAFTSLRATIASINGIAYAKKIPLIGVNSLEALVEAGKEAEVESSRYIIALLNAYNNDAYFRIIDQTTNSLVAESCKNIDLLVQDLSGLDDSVLVLGNGLPLYKETLVKGLGDKLVTPAKNPLVPSVKHIGKLALNIWQQGTDRNIFAIEPYYLKTQLFAIRKTLGS